MFTTPQFFILSGLVLLIVELIIGVNTGFDLVLIGTSLIIGGGAGLLTGSTTLTILISAILSGLYIAFGRAKIQKQLLKVTHHTNVDKLIGKTGLVVRSITPDTPGLVRVDDEDWRASSDEILYEKSKIKVLSIDGVTLKVEKHK